MTVDTAPPLGVAELAHTVRERLADGQGGAVVLLGPPGCGKSFLLDALVDALEPEATVLDHRRNELTGWTEQVRAVVVVDDLQWRSPNEIAVLRSALRRDSRPVVVCATRSGSIAEAAELLGVNAGAITAATPQPVSAAAAKSLLNRFGVTGEVRAAALEARDNPGLMLTLAQAGDVLPTARETALLAGYSGSVELLRAAALLGDRVVLSELTAVLGDDAASLWSAVETAVMSGVLVEDGADGLRFRHPVLARIVAAETSETIRAAIHRRIAHVLSERGGEPVRISEHLIAGGATDPDAARSLLTAAAGRRTPSERILILERALVVAREHGPLHAEIMVALASAHLAAGEIRRAIALIERSLADSFTDYEHSALLAKYLAVAYLLDDQPMRSLDVLRAAVASDVERLSTNVLHLRAEIALRQVLLGDTVSGTEQARDTLALCLEVGDHAGAAIAVGAIAHAAYYRGDTATAVVEAHRAVDFARLAKSEDELRRARYDLGWFQLHNDQLDEAASLFASEVRAAQEAGAAWYAPIVTLGLGVCHYYSGRWDLAREELQRALAPAPSIETKWDTSFGRALLIAMDVECGDLPSARALLGAGSASDHVESTSTDALTWARAHLLSAVGDDRSAYDLLMVTGEKILRAGVPVRLSWLVPSLVAVAERIGELDSCRELLEALEVVVQDSPARHLWAAALRARARMDRDPQVAVDALAAATASGRPLEVGRSAELVAELLADADPVDALAALSQATAAYESLDASRSVLRCRRLAGRIRPARRSAARSGWDSLTATELEIVQRLTTGASNSDIALAHSVSIRTVETHLRNIMRKLEVNSRTQIAAKAARLI